MINKIFFLLVFLSFYSCRNYESEKYIINENKAINDIIPQLVNYDEMVKMNDLDTNHLVLFLISSLDTEIREIYEPRGFIISENGVKLPDAEINNGKRIYEEEYEKYEKEKRLFAPLQNGKLKKRILNYKFEYSNLQIELISNSPSDFKLNQNEFGYLYISRIIFNRNFNKGYLSFSFFCGEACAWDNNIEIVKVNGKWKISECFSGGMACNYKNNPNNIMALSMNPDTAKYPTRCI